MRREEILIGTAELAEALAGAAPPVLADCRFALNDPAFGRG